MHPSSPRLNRFLALAAFTLTALILALCGYAAWNLSSGLHSVDVAASTQEQIEPLLASAQMSFLLIGVLLLILIASLVYLWKSALPTRAEMVDPIENRLEDGPGSNPGPEAHAGKLLEKQMAFSLSEKRTLAAELAASMAHDIRNPLAAIQMSLSNLRADIQDEDLAERTERISAEVARLGRIVTQAVDSTRVEPEEPSRVDLSSLVEEAIQLLRYQVPSSIAIENEVPGDLRCRLPMNRLQEAIVNLIANSAESIGAQAGLIRVEVEISGSDLALSVIDDGPGFPDDLLKTGGRSLTKEGSHGERFRLAIARRITRDVGGSLRLSNEEGGDGPNGARAVLLLPSCVDDG